MRPDPVTAAWAFDAYLVARPRLPPARFGGCTVWADTLAEIADAFDVLLRDACGVLNIGEALMPARVADLKRRGKRVLVVSNSAGYPTRLIADRFARMGFEFAASDIVSSRQALLRQLATAPKRRWGLMLSRARAVGKTSPRWRLSSSRTTKRPTRAWTAFC